MNRFDSSFKYGEIKTSLLMVKFFLEILRNIFITGVVNIFPTAILLLLIPDDILDKLQNLVLKKKRLMFK